MTDRSEVSKWAVLAVTGTGVYMATLDSGIVNVALPTLTEYFNAPVVQSQWVILAYLLCITGLLLPMGRLADIVGRKRIFLSGFALFTIASALCGLAPSLTLLIVARVLQGVGAAMLQANSPGLVTQAFPSSERGRALGINGAIVSAGLLSGPVIGGFIIDWLGWQWSFFVNVPIGLVAIVLGARKLPESAVRPGQRIDMPGAALFMVLVVSLLLALNFGGRLGWTALPVIGMALVAVLSGVLLWIAERRASQPMLDVNLFRNAGFRAATLAAFLVFLATANTQLLMPFYLQQVLNLTPSQVGLLLVTIPATIFILAPIAGVLSDRLGSRVLASAGVFVAALGMLSLVSLGVQSHLIDVVVRQILLAVGLAFFMSPNSSALFGALPREFYGVGGAYQSLTRNLGTSVGQAVAAVLWTSVVVLASGGQRPDTAPAEALMTGFQVAFSVGVALLFASSVVSLFGRPKPVAHRVAPLREPVGAADHGTQR